MKLNFKAILIFIVAVFLSILTINHFSQNKNTNLSGKITIWATENTYPYIEEAAKKFEESHKRVDINVSNVNSKNYYNNLINTNKKDLPNIVELNSSKLSELANKHTISVSDEGNLVNTYKMNFPDNRIQQVVVNDQILGVPFTSRPLVLYLREDVLNKYGHTNSEINTWNDLINVSKDIYKKSKGKYKGLSGYNEDIKDLESLLIMQNMEYNVSNSDIRNNVKNTIKKLKNDNILGKNEKDGFFGRISSINGMKELMAINEKCIWTANNVPAAKTADNRFFNAEGENFAVLNSDENNIGLINAFLEYMTNDTDLALKYVREGRIFSSYLYTYKNKEIEKEVRNFKGKSPLVVMSNIYKKAPKIKEYNDYLSLRQDILSN